MTPSRQKMTAVLLLATAIGAGWLVNEIAARRNILPEHAFVLPEPRQLQDFALTDQNGATFGPQRFKGHWTLLFFGFTYCPDVCPATLQVLSLARQKLLATGHQAPQIVLVSVDPERDTPQVLKDYVTHFGEGISGATAAADELQKLTSTLGVYFEKVETDGEDYSMAHSAQVMLIDTDGRFAAVFSAPHSIDALVHDLPLITRR